jgi:hypothetical protein
MSRLRQTSATLKSQPDYPEQNQRANVQDGLCRRENWPYDIIWDGVLLFTLVPGQTSDTRTTAAGVAHTHTEISRLRDVNTRVRGFDASYRPMRAGPCDYLLCSLMDTVPRDQWRLT